MGHLEDKINELETIKITDIWISVLMNLRRVSSLDYSNNG
jgi:hypothetical protein